MAAQAGVATFVTVQRQVNVTQNVMFQLDDTAGNPILWDVGGGDPAKGAEEWRPPEVVRLADVCIAAASGQTKTSINKLGVRVTTLLNALHLASVTNRPTLSVLFGPNAPISGNQIA